LTGRTIRNPATTPLHCNYPASFTFHRIPKKLFGEASGILLAYYNREARIGMWAKEVLVIHNRNRHRDIVGTLLVLGDITPDTTDKNNPTAFSWAAEQRSELLIEWANLNQDMAAIGPAGQTTHGQTFGKQRWGAPNRPLEN